MAKKKTVQEKIQKEIDKLESLHEKEEAIMENIKELLEEGGSCMSCECKDCDCKKD